MSSVWSKIAKVFISTKAGGVPLRNYIKGIVGDENEISFRLDPWITDEPLKVRFLDLFRLELAKKCKVADRVKSQGNETELVWEWRSVPASAEAVDSLQQLTDLLIGIQISDREDRWFWCSGSAGSILVKAVKQSLFADQPASYNFILEWCRWVPAKCNIHAWRLEMDKIPTGEALKKGTSTLMTLHALYAIRTRNLLIVSSSLALSLRSFGTVSVPGVRSQVFSLFRLRIFSITT
ncbi:hypothetical protein HanHA300_Chr02g0059701 [Helianthus annuus]|nr:hypothetical protein HanHA300_Chr02g0059701 [Helianthus annuus]KAJ0619168.1 hypothetical protein HanHA89_Chr02g0068321 [Helianthus annuus]KAJ0777617.1 hypothetical protein HanLR1_Chr02g0062541 [Helianthus annuus]KAJ0786646.1 hypothetical protein HanOQP8_Chr02g0073651 [Helianthus annuus]